jgi:hypothetical protein
MHAWFVLTAWVEDALTGRKVSAMLTHENVHNNPRPSRPLPTRPAPLPRPTSPRAVDARIDGGTPPASCTPYPRAHELGPAGEGRS